MRQVSRKCIVPGASVQITGILHSSQCQCFINCYGLPAPMQKVTHIAWEILEMFLAQKASALDTSAL